MKKSYYNTSETLEDPIEIYLSTETRERIETLSGLSVDSFIYNLIEKELNFLEEVFSEAPLLDEDQS